jgi:hypothetical protein
MLIDGPTFGVEMRHRIQYVPPVGDTPRSRRTIFMWEHEAPCTTHEVKDFMLTRTTATSLRAPTTTTIATLTATRATRRMLHLQW